MQWELTIPTIFYFAAEMGLNPALHTNFFWTQEDCQAQMAGNEVDLEIGDADDCIKRTESSSYYLATF